MEFKSAFTILVSQGYFPSELPPNFNTIDLGNNAIDILSGWQKSGVFKRNSSHIKTSKGKSNKQDCYAYSLRPTDSEIISKPKRGFERRNLHITHPVPQVLLSYEISKNWKTAQKWLAKQTYSLDKINLSLEFKRGLASIDFSIHAAKKDFIESCNDWVVKTDISRFYPSIYTHSIPWAAYGKEIVKKNMKIYEGSVADRLDQLVRACNRNQTVGIPIGPETSRIISEIISSRIDLNLHERVKIQKNNVDRFQDDWFVGAASLEEAENLLSNINRSYREYGLEINGSKTAVERIIDNKGVDWLGDIAAFLSHRQGDLKGNRLQEFLRLSLRLQIHNKNEPVINYVLSIIEGIFIGRDDVQVIESFLLKSALISPISMDRICRIVLNLRFLTREISKSRIEGSSLF